MKRAIAGVLAISLGLLLKSCDTTDPPDNKSLTLKFEDVSCTEAWIELTTTNLQLPTAVTIKQNNQIQSTINLVKSDTLLYIDSLLPNTTYKYQVSCIQNPVSSNELNVTTMDTTSHNFTWQTWTFGEHSSSVFYDVAIIDENNIWCVGEIYMNDSLGQPDPQPYGIAIWNGQNWELKKIFHSTNIPVTPRGILVISPNEIYLAAGSIFKWNGISSAVVMVFSRLSLPDPNATIEKLWGSSSTSIYGVGNVGSIVYYNGTQWTRIESGTELNIYDICGDYNNETGEYEIIAVAAKIAVNFDKAIIKINETGTVTLLPTIGIPYSIHGIWFKPSKQYYICGAGMFNKKVINSSNPWNELEITNYYTEAISGNGINDIAICGDFGESLHFNGISWKSYQDNFSGVLLLGVKIKDDQIVIVGIDNPKAFISIGHR